MVDTIRTSYGTFLNRRMDAMLARIEKKVALFTKIPEENMEDMQVLKYENGQKYGDHWDVFDERTLNEKDGYQRIATVDQLADDVGLMVAEIFVAKDGTQNVQCSVVGRALHYHIKSSGIG